MTTGEHEWLLRSRESPDQLRGALELEVAPVQRMDKVVQTPFASSTGVTGLEVKARRA